MNSREEPNTSGVNDADVALNSVSTALGDVGQNRSLRELLKNDNCRRLIQTDLDDKDFRIKQAVPELDRMEKNRGITYFHASMVLNSTPVRDPQSLQFVVRILVSGAVLLA